MFLNKTIFKKKIKEAYRKSGLVIGRVFNGLILQGAGWSVWIEEGYVPNWISAAIVEHAGRLPKNGEIYKACHNETDQNVIPDPNSFDLPTIYLSAGEAFFITPIQIDVKYATIRLVQNVFTNKMVSISTGLYDMIGYKDMEQDESYPVGPAATSEEAYMMFWKNEHGILSLSRMSALTDKPREAADLLQEIRFKEDATS